MNDPYRDNKSTADRRRWIMMIAIVGVIVLLLVIIMLLLGGLGGHGPWRHMGLAG